MDRRGQQLERLGLDWRADEPPLTSAPHPGGGLPTGTVTFLLSDVEASTSRWQEEPDAMAAAIERHYELLDEVVAAHRGVRPIEQGEGDSIVAAFASAADAIAAAAAAQRRLAAETWPTGESLQVRMSVHTGDARLRDDANYSGPTIIRAARLRALAHGGQVLVSAATRDVVVDELPDDLELVDLGVHRLRDLSRSEHVWQLVVRGLEREFPPLTSIDVVPNNLPVALSSFVGRFDAIDSLARLVLDNRLVTLTGTGGAGKTRLAQQVASAIVEAFPDGVWWVDLVGVDDGAMVTSAISRAAHLPEDRGDPLEGVARRLAGTRVLLVLDNCEHLVEDCAEVVTAILRRCPNVSVLTTSRIPLATPGEVSWVVPPLDLPADRAAAPDAVARCDAVQLFVDRASRARNGFRLDETNAADVIAICERLDGLPLAIELAAAHCRSLAPAQVRAALNDALAILAVSTRTVRPAHQTMDASIRWSHSLLQPEEQIALRRLSVFAGPFSLEGAGAVVADDRLTSAEVGALVERLVDQSLLQVGGGGAESRFRMLETVRQFARRELAAADELDAVSARHAAHFSSRATQLWPLFGPTMAELLDRADQEFDDLRLMLEWFEAHATPEVHAEVAMACLPAMSVRHPAETAALGERVAARVDDLSVLGGHLHLRLALVDPTLPTHVQIGIAAAQATGDDELGRNAGFWGAWGAATDMPSPAAMATLEAARGGLDEVGELHFSRGHWISAGIDRAVGRHADAQRAWELAVAETTCKRCNVMVWSEGALLALARGDLDSARAHADRAHSLAYEIRDAGFQAHVLLTATELADYAGEPWPAAAVEAGLADAVATGNPMALGYLSEARGIARLAEGRFDDAEADFATAIECLDDAWPKRTEARLRTVACRQARGDHAGARSVLADLRAACGRWEAGPWLSAQLDHRAAALELAEDRVGEADDLAHRALSDAWLGPFVPRLASALELVAAVAVSRESFAEAARLSGSALTLREARGYMARLAPDRAAHDTAMDAARAALGAEAFERAVDEGRRLDLDEAVAYARRARGARRRPSHGWDGLTPTELQVAELAVQGLSNAEIAERLFIGRETVKTHLSNTYSKVGVANRTQLVAYAARRGITP